jgi:beta propeller repeat protein
MKTKSFLIFTVFSICVIALVNLSHAIQVTQNAYEDAFPHMDGNYLVWQGKVGGDWEILLYDIGSGQALQITDNGYNDISPQTDGTYVTWVGYSKAGG